MAILPDHFTTEGLSAIEERKLEYFAEQFVIGRNEYGIGHFLFAAYAAMPAVLTADLTHKLWLNFKSYSHENRESVIHPVAPTDLLLSPLVEEIGLELFEMSESIRKALLVWLEKMTGGTVDASYRFYPPEEIADFLKDYTQFDFTPQNQDDDAFKEAQLWTAMSYLDPANAFRQVATAFQAAAGKELKPDMLRYKDAIEKMHARFSLGIVKDKSMVPKSFEAVTSLTSVIRDIIHKKEPAQLEEFRQQAGVLSENLLTAEAIVADNVISIELPNQVGVKLENVAEKKIQAKRKLRALVIGIHDPLPRPGFENPEFHTNSAAVFAQAIREVLSEPKLIIDVLLGDFTTKFSILDKLNKLVETASDLDDLLIYIAGNAEAYEDHCYVYCKRNLGFGNDRVDLTQELKDEEVRKVLDKSKCASITLILEVNHSATSHWLDRTKSNNILISSCKFQPANKHYEGINPPHGKGHRVCDFTHSLIKSIQEKKLQQSNRDIFIRCLNHYDELYSNADSEENSVFKFPQILCNPEGLIRFFLQGKNSRVELELLLLQTGFIDPPVSGVWDDQTSRGFNNFIRANKLPVNNSKQYYIEELKKLKQEQNQQWPIFLLALYNKKINKVELKKGLESLYVEVIILDNPDPEYLLVLLKDPLNRNRLQLIYLSDDRDRGASAQKATSFLMKQSILDYQQNIQLFITESARSELFAESLTQLGVTMAIGCDDRNVFEGSRSFTLEIFQQIINRSNLEDLFLNREKYPVADRYHFFKAAGNPDTTLGRNAPVKGKETRQRPPKEQVLKILFLAADPSNTARLYLNKELKEVRNKLENNPYFEIIDKQAVKPDNVLEAIMTYKPNIVHFSGHGQDSGEVCFEDEQGKSKPMPPEALASLFSLVTDYVKCVIVNTCYAEKQARAIAQYVPVVIGTKKEISDSAAIKFSTAFYASLDPDLSQDSLNKAFKLGRIAIQFDGNLQEHLLPILIERPAEVRFSSEVDTAFLSISQPKGPAFQTLITELSLTGKKMGLSEEVVKKIIDDKIQKLQVYNESIVEYENSLRDLLRDEFPLSEFALKALLQLQNGLGLSNQDVLAVKNKILIDPKLDSAFNWYDRGRGQYDLKNYEKAIEYFSKAIDKNPEYSGAYYERGCCYQEIQQYEPALADFNKAIDYNKNWEVASNLSLAYFSRGLAYYSIQPRQDENMTKAIKDWSRSIELNSTDPNAYWNRGLAHQNLRNFDKAIADIKKSLEIDTINSNKEKASRVTNLLRCYSELGNQDEIKKWTKVYDELLGKDDDLQNTPGDDADDTK